MERPPEQPDLAAMAGAVPRRAHHPCPPRPRGGGAEFEPSFAAMAGEPTDHRRDPFAGGTATPRPAFPGAGRGATPVSHAALRLAGPLCGPRLRAGTVPGI